MTNAISVFRSLSGYGDKKIYIVFILLNLYELCNYEGDRRGGERQTYR